MKTSFKRVGKGGGAPAKKGRILSPRERGGKGKNLHFPKAVGTPRRAMGKKK